MPDTGGRGGEGTGGQARFPAPVAQSTEADRSSGSALGAVG